MVKRRRNNIGQFISSTSTSSGSKAKFFQENLLQKAKSIFMVLFFLFMASPWLTLAIKSKQIRIWIYSLLQFYSKHFINGEEVMNGFCTPTKEDI